MYPTVALAEPGGELHASERSKPSHPPRVLFLGSAFAGHNTRFLNLKAHSEHDARICPMYRQVTAWVEGGALERLPLLPKGLKARARMVLQGAPLASLPRPDAIWYAGGPAGLPYIWAQLGPLRRPLIVDLDWTFEQQEALAPLYFNRPGHRGARYILARFASEAVGRSATLFTPWSTWAADSLRRQGIHGERIRVMPPGVDLQRWRPHPELRSNDHGPLRLLFVGGDFCRKGGPMLLDVLRHHFLGRCELDVVTRESAAPSPGIRIHRAEPNSPLLHDLYARAELFVMPTRAECFGIATIEAMASGLPVIVSDVGGVRDIVDEGETGWLIEPKPEAIVASLERALAARAQLPRMGERARSVAEARFDGKANDERVVDLLLGLVRQHSH